MSDYKKKRLEFLDDAALKILCAIVSKQGTSEGEAPLVCRSYDLALWLWTERVKRREQLEELDAATK
jgi:hypothetical protein